MSLIDYKSKHFSDLLNVWNNMTDEERDEIIRKAGEAIPDPDKHYLVGGYIPSCCCECHRKYK